MSHARHALFALAAILLATVAFSDGCDLGCELTTDANSTVVCV